MAYQPINKTVVQYVDSTGDPYSGAVLKAYENGTSTVLSMATDSTGGTTATSFALNSDGFPEHSGSIIIPHVNENYKLALYPTQTAADANSGAIWTIDNIKYQELPNISDSSDAVWITVDSNEDATFTATALFAAGEGIVFNGDSNADANRLDDYEEGTWTPVLSDGTNNATSSAAVGRYTKIGRVVYIIGRLEISSLGSVSGAVRITGLPFTSLSDSGTNASISFGFGEQLNVTAGYNVSGTIAINSTYINLYLWDDVAGATSMTGAEWSANGHAFFSGFYFTTA